MRFSPGVFYTRKSAFLLIIYVLLSLGAMNFNDIFALSGIRYALLQTVSWVDQVKTELVRFRSQAGEVDRLKEELFQKSLENSQLKEALLENIRLRQLLKLKKEEKYKVIATRVIGMSAEIGVESLLLDVGEAQGVRKNSAVLSPQGLIGRIIYTTPGQSIVQILMDQNSLVSARTQKSREIGIVSWKGNPWLDLLYVPNNIEVEKGESIVTSGLSRIYPPGIKIGIVSNVKKDKYGFFQKIKIIPAVNFKSLEIVFVLNYKVPADPEDLNAEK